MKKILISSVAIIALILFISNFFIKPDTIKIGLIGALTGKYSLTENDILNGVQLALDTHNYKVNNKKIELILKDDKHDAALNKKYINEFIQNDVKIIIGNFTTSMTKVSLPIINKYDDMFMIAVGSAGNSFSAKDDRFFRVHVANNEQRFDGFTQKMIKDNYKKIYMIYDPINKAYTKDFIENFEKSFVKNGGEKFLSHNKTDVNLDLLVNDIKKTNPDLILIAANSVDSAKVVQYIRMKNINTKVASSEWAMTNDFIINGGKSVEGVLFNIEYDSTSNKKEFISFKEKYIKKYKTQPTIFSSQAYELTQIIIDALKNSDESKIKEQILSKKVYQGLQDEIIFDEYGDVKRKFYSYIIKDGQYERVNN